MASIHRNEEMSGAYTLPGNRVRIRMLRTPKASEFDPFDVSRLEAGRICEVGPMLADALIVGGYAELKMRRLEPDSVADHPRRRKSDRR